MQEGLTEKGIVTYPRRKRGREACSYLGKEHSEQIPQELCRGLEQSMPAEFGEEQGTMAEAGT